MDGWKAQFGLVHMASVTQPIVWLNQILYYDFNIYDSLEESNFLYPIALECMIGLVHICLVSCHW